MSQHTPGPWQVCGGMSPAYQAIKAPGQEPNSYQYIVFGMADTAEDVECGGRPIPAPDMMEQRANAQLIAAAPDLLAVLEEVQAYPEHCDVGVKQRVDEAIAKAKGDSS